MDSEFKVLLCDPLLGPMLKAAAAAGVPWVGVGLPLTPANLRTILRYHPVSAVRQLSYELGLLPRLAAALQQLGEVAAVRQEMAAMLGYDSFTSYSYSRTGLAVADEDVVSELLQAVAQALGPAAEAEVRLLGEALARGQQKHEEAPQAAASRSAEEREEEREGVAEAERRGAGEAACAGDSSSGSSDTPLAGLHGSSSGGEESGSSSDGTRMA
ncbi:hypothetical protein Agub_g10186, partial [Astrephomene gubernaculifera]